MSYEDITKTAFNRTKWNWNLFVQEMMGFPYLLLIVLNGIETESGTGLYGLMPHLLIVLNGIETNILCLCVMPGTIF